MPLDTDTRMKEAARRKVRRLVDEGRIIKQPCAVCGAPSADARHADYSKPLDVRWLCRAHHAELHRELRQEARRGRPPRPSQLVDSPRTAELQQISALIREQQKALRDNEVRRNALVREAIGEGWTHAQVAEATGLTRSRVGQIALAGTR